MDGQMKSNKARIYGYVIGVIAIVGMVAWKLIAR